ncbi:Ig-like domain repeat protein [Candidatus Parcubacteria bacterium]|nr:MAG: Ig-like domain repeat protein [Candidatus Parcubacteria bacterium]
MKMADRGIGFLKEPELTRKWKVRINAAPPRWGDHGPESMVSVVLMNEAGEGVEGELILRINGDESEIKTKDNGTTKKLATGLRIGTNAFAAHLKGRPSVHDTVELDVEPEVGLAVAGPTSTETDVEATATATVSLASRPIKNGEVQFYLDGAKSGAPQPIDTDGSASYTFTGLKKGTHGIWAVLNGTTLRSKTVNVEVKEQKAKKLAEPFPQAEGDDGVYIISFVLTHEDGTAAVNEPVRLLLNRYGRKADEGSDIVDRNTDDHGRFRYLLTFTERECDVMVQVRGWQKDSIKNLHGPMGRRPVELVEPREEDVNRGIIHAALAALRRQREKNREMRS